MLTVEQTDEFADWLKALRNKEAKKRILVRIVRIQSGLLGDHRSVGGRVSEIRVDTGPGYRL